MPDKPIYVYQTHTHIVDDGMHRHKYPNMWVPYKLLCGGRYNDPDLTANIKGPLCKICEKIWNDKS